MLKEREISDLKITVVRDSERRARIELAGELDSRNAGRLAEALALAIYRYSALVIDLRRLEFMDGTGLRAVIEADDLARRRAVGLEILRGPPTVHKVFSLTGFDTRLKFLTVLPTAALP